MKVSVFGAGALGGHIAAHRIASRQSEVSLVGRGALLAAILERGITLKTGGRNIGLPTPVIDVCDADARAGRVVAGEVA